MNILQYIQTFQFWELGFCLFWFARNSWVGIFIFLDSWILVLAYCLIQCHFCSAELPVFKNDIYLCVIIVENRSKKVQMK